MILSQFQTVGEHLFTKGLVSSHSGNLSIRLGDRIIITRRSSRLGCLQEHDLVETQSNNVQHQRGHLMHRRCREVSNHPVKAPPPSEHTEDKFRG